MLTDHGGEFDCSSSSLLFLARFSDGFRLYYISPRDTLRAIVILLQAQQPATTAHSLRWERGRATSYCVNPGVGDSHINATRVLVVPFSVYSWLGAARIILAPLLVGTRI